MLMLMASIGFNWWQSDWVPKPQQKIYKNDQRISTVIETANADDWAPVKQWSGLKPACAEGHQPTPFRGALNMGTKSQSGFCSPSFSSLKKMEKQRSCTACPFKPMEVSIVFTIWLSIKHEVAHVTLKRRKPCIDLYLYTFSCTAYSIFTYCWWTKSCTALDKWNPVKNGLIHVSTGAAFRCISFINNLSQNMS